MIIKFHNRAVMPPRGGWSFPINGELVTRYSEGEIIDALEQARRNAGTFTNRAALEYEVWAYYCGREPNRCAGYVVPGVRVGDELLPEGMVADEGAKAPVRQGPHIWRFLNVVAAQWTPTLAQYFLATINSIGQVLDCKLCKAEWANVRSEMPDPANIKSRIEACQWALAAHNKTNVKLGKPIYTYAKFVTEFGAPLP